MNKWSAAIATRFGKRDILPRNELVMRYWADLQGSAVQKLFDVIEVEYGIPAGILRPEDPLQLLWAPVKTRNPLRWLVYQVYTGDSYLELNWQLYRRLKQAGRPRPASIRTVDDLVRTWAHNGA